MSVAQWIATQARLRPGSTALRCDGQALTYADLARRVDDAAAALARAGVGRGDVLAWLGLNRGDMLVALFACARLGAILMPLNWRLAPPEHRAMLHEAAPVLFVADADFAAASAAHAVAPPHTRCATIGGDAPPGWSRWETLLAAGRGGAVGAGQGGEPGGGADAAAPLLLCYTSGSTGRAKGVLLSADALAANADASDAMHGLGADDRVLTTLPLFHVGGLNILTTPALRAGASVTLHPRFDADAVFDAIESERITLTVLVPAQLDAMLAHPRWRDADLSSLRAISTGSTLVPRRLIDAVHARGVPLIQVWGATETAPIAACLRPEQAVRHAGAAGAPAAGVELRVVDADGRDAAAGASGEVWVRARTLMLGYWRDPEGSARAIDAEGWFHSGDSGHFDEHGLLHIDGRLKDMIICGGENVSPAEVEAVLLDDPDVADAAVVGVADARWGEVVAAAVVARAGVEPSAERLLARFAGRLARFKHPKRLRFVDALPRTALGKVRKDELRRLFAAEAADATASPSAKEGIA
ncbi:AMP-binding protein [Azohydromonas sp.]|uniref:AMP-binding protein n=1 Tax=Azohydromonas sp. TaxID=1872666 RepID=UPI002C213602|nr:AMP-binding protein [Azohydromonas sp.]HMM85252.1 AMP-binding protein [Azohydromonas sp.]